MLINKKYCSPAVLPTPFKVIGIAPPLPDKEAAAVNLIYYRYAQALYDAIFRIVKTRELAEDLRQECFIKIWSSLGQYNAEKGQFFTWILTIVRHLAIDKTRSRSYRESRKTQSLSNSSVFWLADPSGFRPEYIGVKELSNLLTPNQKKVIDLLYFAGFSQVEAAQALEIPLGTVKTRAAAAIKHLRKLYKELAG